MVSRGRAAAYKQTHVLLLSDDQAEGPMMDQEIARALKVGTGGTGTPPLWRPPWVAKSN